MADLAPHPDANDDRGIGPDRDLALSTPRWVKVFGLIALTVLVLVVILLVTGGGGHGPARHTASGFPEGHISVVSAPGHGVNQL